MAKKIPLAAVITISMLVLFAVGVFAISLTVSYVVRTYIVEQSRDFLANFIQLQMRTHLSEKDFLSGDSAQVRADFEKYSTEMAMPEMLKINIRNMDSLIIFSSDPSLIGQKFTDDPELQQALQGSVGVRIGAAERAENITTPVNGEVLEMYVPAVFAGASGQFGVVELYYNFSKISAIIAKTTVVISVLLATLLFCLFALVWALFRFRVIGPLADLLVRIRRAMAGKSVGVELSKGGPDEIRQISISFDTILTHLQDLYDDMDRTVEERTKSLSVAMEDLSVEKNKSEQEAARNKALLSSIGDGLVVTDTNGNISLVNETFERLLGWKKSDVLGRRFFDVVPMEDERGNRVPPEGRALSQALASKHPTTTTTTTTYYYIKKDKSRFPVAINAAPAIQDVKVMGAIEVFRDITKELEVNRVKTEFVSLASHQLRTPLSAMKWTIELMLEKKKIAKAEKERIEDLASSTERLIMLVNDLLNVTRIETGKALGSRARVDLLSLTNGVIAIVKGLARHKNQEFKFASSILEAPADVIPAMYTQAVQNLAANAINYSPAKSKIDVAIDVKGNDYLVAVHNTGSFISKEEGSQIFEKFYRGARSQQVRAEGSGLGLYITKAAVEANGGKAWFESSEKDGTTFFFTVPKPK